MSSSLLLSSRVVVLLAAGGLACRDAEVTPSRTAEAIRIAASAAILPVNWQAFPATNAKATPWIGMSSATLAQEIVKTRGRAMIGLKDPNATSGVDAVGRSLALPSSISAGKARLKALGLATLYEFRKIPAVVVQFAATAALVDSLRSSPYLEYIEPDVYGGVLSQTTTWNMSRVQAPTAWSYTTGTGVKLLIIDTGVGPHEDLNVPVAFNCISGQQTNDVTGHGTAVAGIAAALNNSIDVVGVSSGVSLWSANAWDNTVNKITASQLACSIDVGRVNNVSVVNMSIRLDTASTTVSNEIIGGYNLDNILFVAAAGNNGALGNGYVDYPASMAEVIAVAATMYNDTRAPYSSYGSKIELSAPGDSTGYDGVLTTALSTGSICGALPGLNVGKCNGTSSASPHVAAAAALVRAYNPTMTNAAVRTRLGCSARYLGDPTYYGNGMVQARRAVLGIC